ncbi:MAG: methyltransferase domain-containing protein [Chloroflexi bacterium]|nr:methyltransferase domain-containing protein [Chloroflexota bacterium]
MPSDWYQHFFQGVPLDAWSAIIRRQTPAEADFIESVLNVQKGGRVLDVPCGDGRLSIELARRGYKMTGADLSEDCLRRAREQTTAEKVSVEWLWADMRDLPWQAEFDGAFCFGNSFTYLPHAEMRRFLSSLSRALKPGARFLVDTGMAAESILLNLQEREWVHADDIYMLLEHEYVPAESRVDTKYTFLRNGVTETRESHHWVYTIAEIRRLLDDAGLATVSLFGSLDKAPFEVGDPRLLMVGERRT